MFHRVKSEVQDAEQKPQQGYAGAAYRPQERSRVFEEREEIVQEQEETKVRTARAYDKTETVTPKEEEETMEEQLDTNAQQDKFSHEESRVRAPEPQAYGYQRPGQSATAPARPSSYGGSSYGAGSYSAAVAESAAYSGNDRTLTIGRGINMSGEIDACDHLVVEGTVEAALKGAKVLDIAESGTFYGTVEIEEATIAGRFEGDITVNGRLTIRASGAITGSIAYRELEVEAGAMLDGRMTPLKGTVDPKSADKYRAGSEASAMAKAKEIVSKKEREPANAERGGALFSKARANS